MQDSEGNTTRASLLGAADKFRERNYTAAANILMGLKSTNPAIELNLLILELKNSPAGAEAILKKMTDILTSINIKLYNERPLVLANGAHNNPFTKISHEFYFWNSLVIAQILGKHEMAILIGRQALEYYRSMRTETSLMIIYQMLNAMTAQNRLASCVSLLEKFILVFHHAKILSRTSQQYRIMNQILFIKTLLRLGLREESKKMYMLQLDEADEQAFKDRVPFKIYKALLHAEIELHNGNYSFCLKILSEVMAMTGELSANLAQQIRAFIDNNVAIVMIMIGQNSFAQNMMLQSAKKLHYNGAAPSNERSVNAQFSKQNVLIANLKQKPTLKNSSQFYKDLEHAPYSYSYKVNYRKAEICFNYYHEMLKQHGKVLAWAQIHDQSDVTYFYPNLPYFQQKRKDRNPNYTNGKYFYPRYVLNQSSHGLQQHTRYHDETQSKDKPQISAQAQEKIRQGNEELAKLREVLNKAEGYLKQALSILEEERKVTIHLQVPEMGLTAASVSQKLQSEYMQFRGSIYMLLCYLFLCKHEWTKVVCYAQQYRRFEAKYPEDKKSPSQKECHFNILTYQMEACSELSKMPDAYEIMMVAAGAGCSEKMMLNACSTTSHKEYYTEITSQYNNFLYNIAVLHSRNNRIAECHQAIQKTLTNLQLVPSSTHANIPKYIVDLLIHYNLRTYNHPSALQMIKRKRILSLQGMTVSGVYPILNITK